MKYNEKDLNELKEQILKDGDSLVSKRDLLERFCEIDKEYDGLSWNLLQILANINVLVGQEPCEELVNRKEIQQKINRLWNSNGDKDYCMETLRDFVTELPPVKPTQRWISVSQSQIDEAEEVKAIPLEKVEQAREKIWKKVYEYSGTGDEVLQAYSDGFKASLKIIDKLIEEVEE